MLQALAEKITFAGGEASDELQGRADLARYQVCVARAENMVVLLEGAMTRRPGTRFVLELKNEAQKGRLIPFRFSGSDSYMKVVNGGVVRILKDGGFLLDGIVPYEYPVPYVEADLPNLRWGQIGNSLFVASGAHEIREIIRNGHTDWTVTEYRPDGGPLGTQNFDTSKTIQANDITGSVILTANFNLFDPAKHLNAVFRLDEPDLAAVPLWIGNETGLSAGNRRRFAGNVYEVVSGTDSGVNAPTHDEGDQSSGQGKVTWRYLHSGFGSVRITAILSPTTATATVISRLPESVRDGPTYRWHPPAWNAVDGWPKLVKVHRRGLFVARDQDWWLSVPGEPRNMTIAFDPNDADSAIASSMFSQDGSIVSIQWAHSASVLVLGATDSEWIMRAPSLFDALTLANVQVDMDQQEGSAPQMPVPAQGGVLWISRSRERLMFGKFDRLPEAIEVEEVSKSARHILKGKAQGFTYQHDPHRIAWGYDASGLLIACTFIPKDQVVGWTRHPMTNGFVEDVQSIPSSDQGVSEVYMIVRRVINGQVRRYVEQLGPFFEPVDPDNPTAEGAWLVDCALAYQGPETTEVGGLDHLIGEKVRIVDRGAQLPGLYTVGTDGFVRNLPRPVADAVIGLPMRSYVKTLPFDVSGNEGKRGDQKRASHVLLDRTKAIGGEIAVNGGEPSPVDVTGAEDYGEPMRLRSGREFVGTFSPRDTDCTVELILDNALPFTLRGLSPDIDAE